jgi:arylsulfatase A-like enzyme
MYSNTIIVFTSDNGAAKNKFDEPFFANAPLRGHKGLLWDGGIHVPAFVAGGFVRDSARGRTLDGLMGVQDWYATLAYVSGAQVDNDGQFPSDSINNWLYIVGEAEKSAREKLILHFHGQSPPAHLPSKTEAFGLEDGRQSVLRRGQYKMYKRPDTDGNILTEFYDLLADPGETNNLAKGDHIPQSIADYIVEMEDELDSSWFEAYQQPWFRTGVLDVNKNDGEKACATWLKNGGYLTPWADEQDEMLLQARISVR